MPGASTAMVARMLAERWRGYQVLTDLRGPAQAGGTLPDAVPEIGKIVAWAPPKLARGPQLAFLDIALVRESDSKTIMLIEIEETTAKPKVLLGDAFATLMGTGVSFSGRQLDIGSWTTLLILGAANPNGAEGRVIHFLGEQLDALKPKLQTPNAAIGHVVVGVFAKNVLPDLMKKVADEFEKAQKHATS